MAQITLALAGMLVVLAAPAQAWDKHFSFAALLLKHLPQDLRVRAEARFRGACPDPTAQAKRYQALAAAFNLQTGAAPNEKTLKLTPSFCPKTVADFFVSSVFDEPDHGIDQDLPESADPHHFRKWMGGVTGPTSQGFRHMYFVGFEWLHPLRSFQIPLSAVGEAPNRVEALATEAKRLLQSTDPDDVFWGFRLLGWASHYIQDLSQPFHSTQIPSLAMVPWASLLKGTLVAETTRVISNYHWAYENYVRDTLFSDPAIFEPCFDGALSPSAARAMENSPEASALTPAQIAKEAAWSSRELAPRLGQAIMATFGKSLQDPSIDLPHFKGTAPQLSAEQSGPGSAIREVSCEALRNTFTHTERLIRLVL